MTTSQSYFDRHSEGDEADPKFITVTNSTAYRYYAFKFADNWGGYAWMGLRRVELRVNDLFLVDESVVLEDPTLVRKSWIDTINEVKVQRSDIYWEGL